ncbi:hypothetical protein E6O75_ATG04187 [Venturia nashicola]|uniref:Uncharacterized protein n=1 Tax=Venturia nashicola TaxID=86259 RepID=A0A4Z1PQ07_9PEZI|nr:hypothetical protein E6O75_ATG04187 [Venturia nashicola]
MRLLTLALCALISITLAIPVDQASSETTNLAVDCPIRPEVGPVSASLCADTDWLGYCHVYVTCEGSCFDVVDYGVAGMFGDGISSVMFPVGQSCKFFSGRNCDWKDGPWDGSFWGQRDVDWFANGPNDPNPHYSALNNKIRSFMCSHGTLTPSKMKRDDLALEAVEERGEPSFEVREKRADPESAEVATSSIVGQPITSDNTDDVPVRNPQKASSVIGHPTTSNKTQDVPRFTLQTCIDRDYGSCALWPGLFNGLCMNDPGHLALLISTKSIKLLEDQSCVLYKAMDCVGENVIITKSEPRLDYFPNEGGVTADMEGEISSVWCCQDPGQHSCDNTCLCYQGVTLEPGGNRRILERSPLLD